MSEEQLGGGQVPAGKYTARAMAETVIHGAASTGTKQIAMSFEIVKGKFAGERLPWFCFFTEASEERSIEQLMLAGARMNNGDINDLAGLGDVEVEIQTEVTEHPDTGALQYRVAWVNEPGGVFMKTTMDDNEKKVFAKALKDKVLAIQAKHGKRKPSRSTAPALSKEPVQAAAAAK